MDQFAYDDYPFYRGLVGSGIRWAAIDDGATVEGRLGRQILLSVKSNRLNLLWYGFPEVWP